MSRKQVTEEIVFDVIDGKYGNRDEREERLTEAGYDYTEVQSAVNNKLQELYKFVNRRVWSRAKDYFKEIRRARTLKACTKNLFEAISCEFDTYNKSITISNIEYRNGYFLFYMGKNSVVHFDIDELPEWKFGVWWKVPKDKNISTIKGTLFAQLADGIDKFKPTNSNICIEFEVSVGDYSISVETDEIFEQLNYMLVHRYACICGELFYDEPETEQIAMEAYAKYCMQESAEDACRQVLDNYVIDFVREHWLPNIEGAEIGWESFYPHYYVHAPFKDNTDIVSEAGCYNIIPSSEKFAISEFDELLKTCVHIAESNNAYWVYPIEKVIYFED